MGFETFQVFVGSDTNGTPIRKGIATDSEDLEDQGPEFFFPPGCKITKGPLIRIEDFVGLDDVVIFE